MTNKQHQFACSSKSNYLQGHQNDKRQSLILFSVRHDKHNAHNKIETHKVTQTYA